MVDSSCLSPQAVPVTVSQAGRQGPIIPPVMEGAGPWTPTRAGARNPALHYHAMGQGPAIFSSSTRTLGCAITEIPVIFIMLQAGIPSDRLSSSRASLSRGNVSSSSSLQTLVCSILLLLTSHPRPCVLMLLLGDHPVTDSLEGSDD